MPRSLSPDSSSNLLLGNHLGNDLRSDQRCLMNNMAEDKEEKLLLNSLQKLKHGAGETSGSRMIASLFYNTTLQLHSIFIHNIYIYIYCMYINIKN